MNRFAGKVVVITGATSGIGFAMAKAFTAEGARVVGTGRDQARLMTLADEVELALTLDVTSEDSVMMAAAAIQDGPGAADILINNAGIGLFESWDNTSIRDYQRILDVNLLGVIRITHALLPAMVERGSGCVVNVSSVAGKRGYPKHTAYCASKHALLGYTTGLRKDLNGSGVSVIGICPPAVDTPFFENSGFLDYKAKHEGLKLMSPEEVAAGTLDAIANGKRERILGARAKTLWFLDTFLPGGVDLLQKLKR
ncbi:MAG: short-subunit dehydrogenase [Myxococcota bacterium]|jgi:short-subunit dehydrogenase